jgi:hypothetical protein
MMLHPAIKINKTTKAGSFEPAFSHKYYFVIVLVSQELFLSGP